MITYTDFFPGALAGLLSDEFRDEAMANLRENYDAFVWCRDQCPLASMKRIIKDSIFRTTSMRWVTFFGTRTGWRQSPQMMTMVDSIWSSWCQSRIMEVANQKLRDHETRDGPSRVLRHITMWQIPVEHEIMKSYDRPEIAPEQLAARVPDTETMDRMFTPYVRKSREQMQRLSEQEHDREVLRQQWDEELKKLTGKQDWQTSTPESKQHRIAEQKLMLHVYRLRDWTPVSEVWRCRFVPRLELLENTAQKELFLVLKSYDCAILGWPAKVDRNGVYSVDGDIKKLKWEFVVDFDAYNVLHTEAISPVHRFLLGERENLGIAWKKTGEPKKLLDWNVDNGFPGVPEAAMKKLFGQMNVDPPSETSAHDHEEELKVAMIANQRPAWTQEEALMALHKAFNGNMYICWCLSPRISVTSCCCDSVL